MIVERWRPKPTVVEAVYLTPENAVEVAEWCDGQVAYVGTLTEREHRPFALTLLTTEGPYTLRIVPRPGEYGWWIVKGPLGEFSPCRDDVWREGHEPTVPDLPRNWRGAEGCGSTRR